MINHKNDAKTQVAFACKELRKNIYRAVEFKDSAVEMLSLAEKWLEGKVGFTEVEKVTGSDVFGDPRLQHLSNNHKYQYLLAVFCVLVIIANEYPEEKPDGVTYHPFGALHHILHMIKKWESK